MKGEGGDRLLTVREVATAMRVSHMTVYRMIKSGDLPAFRVGRNFRIRESDVDGYLTTRSVAVGRLAAPPAERVEEGS